MKWCRIIEAFGYQVLLRLDFDENVNPTVVIQCIDEGRNEADIITYPSESVAMSFIDNCPDQFIIDWLYSKELITPENTESNG